jgi:Uma2 family endonuclease
MTVVTALPFGRALTRDDLVDLPDDGHRYELIDGTLLVTPSPGHHHQRAVARLLRLLEDACPRDFEVVIAPFAIVFSDDTELQPDLLVARRSDITPKDLRSAPLLAVEILSRSTRSFDLHTKRARFEQEGTPSYWVIDPDEPSLTAWELHDGAYVEVARVAGNETFRATLPYAVDVTPRLLVADPA